MVESKKGNFFFLPAIAAFSAGAVAAPGYEVVRVTLARPAPYREGFLVVDRYLREQGRPPQALCGMELRSPCQVSFAEFGEFNRGYVELLKERDILVDGLNPVARTNVAPEIDPPSEASLYAFSYTAPASASGTSFVVAGGGDRRVESTEASDIVRQADVSADAMREKADYVLGLMESRLASLGASWPQVTAVNAYTAQNLFPLMRALLLPRLGPAKLRGICWHFARPPVRGMEFEMSMQGCRCELTLRE